MGLSGKHQPLFTFRIIYSVYSFFSLIYFSPLLNKSQPEQGHCSLPSSHNTTATDPIRFIDEMLQDTLLFVMEVNHDKILVRNEAFYRRGCTLVEQVKSRLDKMTSVSNYAAQGSERH